MTAPGWRPGGWGACDRCPQGHRRKAGWALGWGTWGGFAGLGAQRGVVVTESTKPSHDRGGDWKEEGHTLDVDGKLRPPVWPPEAPVGPQIPRVRPGSTPALAWGSLRTDPEPEQHPPPLRAEQTASGSRHRCLPHWHLSVSQDRDGGAGEGAVPWTPLPLSSAPTLSVWGLHE